MDCSGRNLEDHNGEKNASAESQFPEVSEGNKILSRTG